MNFLSHYYCDSKKDVPYYNLGLAIPDLMSMFKRGWKINDKSINQKFQEEHISMAEGIRQHLTADMYFHQSDFFLRNTSKIKNMMIDDGINYRGTHFLFLSHILLEICIDRQIVLNLPDIVDRFYKDLAGINTQRIADFFDEMGVPVPDGFFVFYRRFINDKFLYNYSDIEKIMFMYNRILTRVNMIVIDPDEYGKLSNVIYSVDELLSKELPDRESYKILTQS